ncbi:phosphoenolpyruvate carboxykinase (ATP) [Propionispira arboris]|uniref:Phosphoenolpyruvate carboxykinase (ATP) n=1 Tax=Propionispira arboris TaxID=84035 RepID=A0A1H6XDD4_9FIRM|nr:phosphoenolpyruvate carboxykinase (ATP) [Propionispira arboris]SEJ25514.1 phosphoenolpyruvate carboxykinase (ATP) [Propionispira arboris]
MGISLSRQKSSHDLLAGARRVSHDLSVVELIEEAVKNQEGVLSDTGALCVTTGKHTGRSPKDKFIVDTPAVHELISWTNNTPCSEDTFNRLYAKMKKYGEDHQLYVTDVYAGADLENRLQVKFINELAWQHLFIKQLFIKPEKKPSEKEGFTVVCMPGVKADPVEDKTHSETFIILNFDKKMVLIGGGRYAGEMKKSIFSVMNYILPQKGILSMHCSANVGKDGNSALFFGLSGTGKTTLSADPNRNLIGDDEHGWSDEGIFNIEGGCYAKCIKLTEDSEPEIFRAIKYGTVLENVHIQDKTRHADYFDTRYTENTRTAYPLDFIPNAVHPSIAEHPTAIIFLTADAFGVLPPISKLTKEQAMYHFLSGYTSKVAGTERGITEPQATFSIGFGEPFLPLSPLKYARLLGEKIDKFNTHVYLLNTGWSGGPYGVGRRMDLKYTRAMVTAALDGKLDDVDWEIDPIFQVAIPASCPDVPTEILKPSNTWNNKKDYKIQAKKLAKRFAENVEKFKGAMPDDILNAGPKVE